MDGVLTLATKNTGPAVVGFLDGAIVLLRWVLTMTGRERRPVVMGEMVVGGSAWRESLRSGDAVLSADGHDTRGIPRPFRGNRPPGAPAVPYKVRVRRGAEELELEVTS